MRILAFFAVAALALAGCGSRRDPVAKYPTAAGLRISETGIGKAPNETDPDLERRGAQMAALLSAYGAWCESFGTLLEDTRQREFVLPQELSDPEQPAQDLSNLGPYASSVEATAERLRFRENTLSGDSEGFDIETTLALGVTLSVRSTVDDLGMQQSYRVVATIGETSSYRFPMRVVVERGLLSEPGAATVPLEFLRRMLEGQRFQTSLREIEPGRAEATVEASFEKAPQRRRR